MIGPKADVRTPKKVTARMLTDLDKRDGHRCAWHGDCDPATLVPHHRSNRGQGGDRTKNRLSNLVWLCSTVNGLIEADPEWADRARNLGIKLSIHDRPEEKVMDHAVHGWCWLDDDGNVLSNRPLRASVLVTMNPDCRDGKHRACRGDAWDVSKDEPMPCGCPCHDGEEVA